MANEQLTIQPNDARMTVIGKSWPDTSTDSGGGDWDDTYNGAYSGPIPRTDLPVRIAVITPPTKTEYKKSERIDFDGMVVTAYNEDGTVWTSEQYPDGTIPLNELIANPIIASASEFTERYADVDGHSFPVFYGDRLMSDMSKKFIGGYHGSFRPRENYSAEGYVALAAAMISLNARPFVAFTYGNEGRMAIDIAQRSYLQTDDVNLSFWGNGRVQEWEDPLVSENIYVKKYFTAISFSPNDISMGSYYKHNIKVEREDGTSYGESDRGEAIFQAREHLLENQYYFKKFWGPYPNKNFNAYILSGYYSDPENDRRFRDGLCPLEGTLGQPYSYNHNPTRYTFGNGFALPVPAIPDSMLDNNGYLPLATALQIAESAIYSGKSAGKQRVLWHRPADGIVLSASFNITVTK